MAIRRRARRLQTHLASRRGGELNHCAPAGNSGTLSPPPLRSTPWMKRRNAATRSACCAVPEEAAGWGCGSSAFSSALGLAKERACAHALQHGLSPETRAWYIHVLHGLLRAPRPCLNMRASSSWWAGGIMARMGKPRGQCCWPRHWPDEARWQSRC